MARETPTKIINWCISPLRVAALLGLTLAASVGPATAGSGSLDLRGAWTFDSNVSNAEVESLRESDSIFEFDAIAGYRQQIGDNSGVVVKGGIENDLHATYGSLNSITLMGSLAYVVQPNRSFSAPWFAVSTDLRWRHHEASDIRDGTIATLAFTAGKQFTDTVSAQVRFELLDREGKKARSFDLNQRIISAVADYRVDNRLTAYAKYQYLDGGLVTTSPPNPKFKNVNRAFAPDPVFGAGRMAWRLNGSVHSFRIGGKYTLADRTALDVGVTYSHADANNDSQWNVWQVGVGVLHRF